MRHILQLVQLRYVLAFGAAGLLSASCIAAARRWAARVGFLDRPSERGAHRVLTPRMGGWGVAAGLLALVLLHPSPRTRVLLAAGLVVFATGLWDDRRGLSPAAKLAGQAAAAGIFLWWAGPVRALALPYWTWAPSAYAATAVSLLWLLAFTNFFNFMDGVNGMAGGTAVLYGLYLFVLAVRSGTDGSVGLVLAGASAGFLAWNARGRVFLGDAGSLLIGFCLAAEALRFPNPGAVTAAVMGLGIMLWDPLLTLARRTLQRQPIWQAHRTHLYQRLLPLASHGSIAALYCALSMVGMALGWFYVRDGDAARAVLLALLVALYVLFTAVVTWLEPVQLRPRMLRILNMAAVGAVSAALLAGAYVTSYLLRFNLQLPPAQWERLARTAPFVLAWQLLCLIPFRLFRGWWRYTSLPDLYDVLGAAVLGAAGCLALGWLSGGADYIPLSIVVLDAILVVGALAGARLTWRAMLEMRGGIHGRRAVIVGAGEAGGTLVRDLKRQPETGLRPIAFVDDDGGKIGLRLFGLKVLGPTQRLAQICAELGAQEVIVTAELSPSKLRELVGICNQGQVHFQILPPLRQMLGQSSLARQLRDIQVEDLLAREEVTVDLSALRGDLADTTVLVTGAAGSIGSELARQVAQLGCARLVLLDRAESPLHDLGCELGEQHPDLALHLELADMLDRPAVDAAFSRWQPAIVYHCAAYKHVPLLELNLVTAVRNNVAGLVNVLTAAHGNRCRRFVLISTDKAVRPASVMGMTKRLCEMLTLGAAAAPMITCAVRFGNVLGSNGSVVPLFLRQLRRGQPLTVTHPDVTRYFMTVTEAVQLVIQAGCAAVGNEIFMLEMGEPVRIMDLARNLQVLNALRGGKISPVVVTGLRPGEKLTEQLHSEEECQRATEYKKIYRLEFDRNQFVEAWNALPGMLSAIAANDSAALLETCCRLVPQFTPSLDVQARLPEQSHAARA